MGCSPWDCEELVMTEQLIVSHFHRVSSESLGQATSKNPWFHARKNLRVSHSKVKADLFREIHMP